MLCSTLSAATKTLQEMSRRCYTTQRLEQIFSQRRNKIARYAGSNSKYFCQLTEQGFFCVKMCSLLSIKTAIQANKASPQWWWVCLCQILSSITRTLFMYRHVSSFNKLFKERESIKLPLKLFISFHVCPSLNMTDFTTQRSLHSC